MFTESQLPSIRIGARKRTRTSAACLSMGLFVASLAAPRPVFAVDGCKALLCLAAPSWRAISECVPTINQLNWDLAHGKPFPPCTMAGAGNSANNAWSSAPGNCPPQYVVITESESGSVYRCPYAGVVTVTINGAAFTRTWWRMDGNTVTEFTPAAKTQLGTWNTQFDDDYAAWLALQAAPTSSCTSC